jgi:hypothetical protein
MIALLRAAMFVLACGLAQAETQPNAAPTNPRLTRDTDPCTMVASDLAKMKKAAQRKAYIEIPLLDIQARFHIRHCDPHHGWREKSIAEQNMYWDVVTPDMRKVLALRGGTRDSNRYARPSDWRAAGPWDIWIYKKRGAVEFYNFKNGKLTGTVKR